MTERSASSLRIVVWLAVLGLVPAPAALAQFRASVQGSVQDASGGVLPGVSVVLRSVDTGRRLETVTSAEGFYSIGGLAPGRYDVSAALAGFQATTVTGVQVSAESVRGLNLTLQPASVTETITVNAPAPGFQTESGSVAGTLGELQVRALPQVGRDPYELLRLAPGVFGDGARAAGGGAANLPNVTGPGGSGNSVFAVENQVQISANGQRVSANNFTLDGVSVNSLGFGGAAVVTPNQESVREIRVLSSSYSAEDGRNSGAQIKVVSQSGGNAWHGSALYKYDDPSLNAFNKYGGFGNAPPVRVEQRFRQFAGSLGGPIVKDKLFFFVSLEGLRNNAVDFANVYAETSQFRDLVRRARPGGVSAGIFGEPGIEPRVVGVLTPSCAVFGDRPCQVVGDGLDIGSPAGALGAYTGFGGDGLDGIPDLQYVRVGVPQRQRAWQYNARLDWQSGANHFAASAYVTRREDNVGDVGAQARPMADVTFKPVNTAVTITWNRVLSPTLMNEARFNVTRFAADQVQDSPDTNWGIPRVEVEGFPFDRVRFGAPRGETTPGVFAQNTYEFRNILTKVWGRHALKAGLELRREQDNNNLAGGARPVYSFVGLFNLANDAPVFEGINADPRTGATADIQRYFRTHYVAAFLQDDLKLRPNLSLNLGLRYEYFSPLTEKDGRLTNLQFGPNGLVDSRVAAVDRLYDPDRNNLGPRLGFAWSPRRFDDRLVLRGGFGVFYNRTPSVLFTNARGNPPYLVRYGLCCAFSAVDLVNTGIVYTRGAGTTPFGYPPNPRLAQGIDPVSGGPAQGEGEIWGAPQKLPNTTVYSFSFEGQYRLPWHLSATVGYQGSRTRKLLRIANQNFLFDQRNPKFFAVYLPTPDGDARYDSLNLRLAREFANGLQFEAAYRLSRSTDTLSYEGPGAPTNQTNPRDIDSERGPSDYDARHSFQFSGVWELPILRQRDDVLARLLGGWQLSGIVTAHSGYPWTPKTGRPLSTPGVSPTRPVAKLQDSPTGRSNGDFIDGIFPGGGASYFDITSAGAPGVGRNSERGPRYFSVDAALGKRVGLPRGARLELRANAFNLFNTLNLKPFGFFSDGTFVENPNFGRADGALAGRVVELQARLSF